MVMMNTACAINELATQTLENSVVEKAQGALACLLVLLLV
jgi:hypothetical protein